MGVNEDAVTVTAAPNTTVKIKTTTIMRYMILFLLHGSTTSTAFGERGIWVHADASSWRDDME